MVRYRVLFPKRKKIGGNKKVQFSVVIHVSLLNVCVYVSELGAGADRF